MKIAFVMYNMLSTERMSVMLLSALAKQHFPHAVVDMFVRSNGRLKRELGEFKPDVVAFSAMTGEHTLYLETAKEVRAIGTQIGKKIFTIMGGPHCTFAPEVLRGSALDAICVGEGDVAWIELLAALEAGKNINAIANIVTQENFDLVVEPANLKKDNYVAFRATNMAVRTCSDPINHRGCLDHLPFLDWELYLRKTDFDKFNSLSKRTIMTRRGCPYPCTYCFNRVFNSLYEGRTIHNYSVDRVIAECEHVGKHFPTEFWKIYDDIAFFSSKGREGERLREFAEKWPRKIGLPFFVLTRADLVAKDPDILRLLRRAGCVSNTMSIEGGNEYVRNRVLERSMPDSDVIFSHHLAWDLRMTTFSNVIFSVPVKAEEIAEHHLPPRSIERDIASVKLAMDAKVHFLGCPQLFPYPGTKLGKYCEESGFFTAGDKLPQSYETLSPLNCLTLEEKKMSRNLALLAMWCVYFASRRSAFVRKVVSPAFFWLVTKQLIRVQWDWVSKIYFMAWFLLQQWLCAAELYRPKHKPPVQVFFGGLAMRFNYEYFKQWPKRRKEVG